MGVLYNRWSCRYPPGNKSFKEKLTYLVFDTSFCSGSWGELQQAINIQKLKNDKDEAIKNAKTFIRSWEDCEQPGRLEVTVEVPLDAKGDGKFTMRKFEKQLARSIHDILSVIADKRIHGHRAAHYASLMELYIDGLNGLADAAITLLQSKPPSSDTSRYYEEFARVKKSIRAHFACLYNGRLSYSNKYFFCPLLQIYMGRPVFHPETFAPVVHSILLRVVGGRTNFDKLLLQFYGEIFLLNSVEAQRSLNRMKDTLLRPSFAGQSSGSRIPAVACKHCKMLFSKGIQLMERFMVHPCRVLKEDNRTESDIIDVTDPIFVDYRAEKCSLRSLSQNILSKVVFENKRNVIVIGAAGAGKTHGVLDVIETIAETTGLESMVRVAQNKKNAENIGGATVNAMFGLGKMDFNRVYKYIHTRGDERIEAVRKFLRSMKEDRIEHIRNAIYLIWDEFGMILLEVFEFLDLLCQLIRGVELPFGGLQLILVGDPAQNKPFVDDSVRSQYASGMKRSWPVHADAEDYIFQSTTIVNSGYYFLLFKENKRMEDCPRLVTFNSNVRLSNATAEDLNYMREINANSEVPEIHRELSVVADMIAHLKKDFRHTPGDKEIISFLSNPDDYDTVQRKPSSWPYEPIRGGSNVVVGQRKDDIRGGRIRRSFNAAYHLLRNGWLRTAAQRLAESTIDVTHIVTDRCQRDALSFLEKFLMADRHPLIESDEEISIKIYDPQSNTVLANYYALGDKKDIFSDSHCQQAIRNESEGKLEESIRIFAGEEDLLTSNNAGHFLPSNDTVKPRCLKHMTDTNETAIEVNVCLEGGLNMPCRLIKKEVCAEISLSWQSLPKHVQEKLKRANHNGCSLIVQRTQFPFVHRTAITSIKSAGLTIRGKVIANNTRWVKAGDMYVCSSRCRDSKDLYFSHIPETVAEMNTFDFVCNEPAKVFLEHLEERYVWQLGNPTIPANFRVWQNKIDVYSQQLGRKRLFSNLP